MLFFAFYFVALQELLRRRRREIRFHLKSIKLFKFLFENGINYFKIFYFVSTKCLFIKKMFIIH